MISHGAFQPAIRTWGGADFGGFMDARGMKYALCAAYPPEALGKQCVVLFWDNGRSYYVLRNDAGRPLINGQAQLTSCGTKMFITAWDKTDEATPVRYLFELENAVAWR